MLSSESDENDKRLVANSTSAQRCRTLRARKTWNYAKMLESNSEVSEDSDKVQDLRPRKQRRCLRRNLQERHYVENSHSSEEDDDEGVNISVSVSSRGRIRRLTAKARASVFRD